MEDTSDTIKTMILKQLKPSVITFGDEINLSVILGENWCEDFSNNDNFTTEIDVLEKKKTTKEVLCTFCNKSFPSRRYLNRHLSKHTNQFICPYCNKVFSRKETLTKHTPRCKKVNPKVCQERKRKLISYNETNKYYCEKCTKKFTRRENYDQHLMIHNRMQVICHICQKVLGSFKSYRRHQQIHVENKDKLSCQYCPATFSLKSNLQRHYKSFRHQKVDITCGKCNYNIKTEQLLLKHQNNETMSCIACSKIFCLEKDFKNHLKTVHQNLWFKCKECSKTTPFMTRWEHNLRNHTKKIHNLLLGNSDCYKDEWFILLNN